MPPYMPESTAEPEREAVDQMPGLVVLEFGASWCPHCQAAQPALKAELDRRLAAAPPLLARYALS